MGFEPATLLSGKNAAIPATRARYCHRSLGVSRQFHRIALENFAHSCNALSGRQRCVGPPMSVCTHPGLNISTLIPCGSTSFARIDIAMFNAALSVEDFQQ